ncbi:hypothetical protein GCG21_14615 [Pseudactinotalea sp. HY160]|uniref:DUF6297 family protein n=1 Tax=Pseudactinotalea sp. HY160 TaxID=2654490 RepID=UPI00128C8269|nr:hypothetical protein [Pseudactinotalea sp. HY160]
MSVTGAHIRGLTRAATKAHGGGKSSDLFGDVYVIAINIAIALGMAVGLLNYLNATIRSHDAAAGMNPLWFTLSLAVAFLGAAIGLAARLGPVNLSGGQAAWWLPMPVDRGGLVRPRFFLVLALGAALGALGGVLLSALASGTVVWGLVAAAALVLLLAVTATAGAQTRPRTRRRPGAIVIGDVLMAISPVPVLLAVVLTAEPRIPGVAGGWPALAVLAALTLASIVAVTRRLGRISGNDLRERGAVSSYAGGAVTSLDTRELGRALNAATAPDRRRRSLGFDWVHGPVAAVVTADALLLLRSGRAIIQILVAALIPLTVAWSGWPVWAVIVAVLLGGLLAASATGEGARRAEMAPVLDAVFPLSAATMRRARFVVPAIVSTAWLLLVIGLGWAWAEPPLAGWLVLALVAGPLYGAGALRSAYRKPVDWSKPLVHTPGGMAIPPGVFGAVSAGPDVVVLCGLPLWLAIGAFGPSPVVIMFQLAATLIAYAIGTHVKKKD